MKLWHQIILVLAALAFVWFVWPTPYVYVPVRPGDRFAIPLPQGGFSRFPYLCRVNRFTGRVQVYEVSHWSNPGSAQGKWVWGWTDM